MMKIKYVRFYEVIQAPMNFNIKYINVNLPQFRGYQVEFDRELNSVKISVKGETIYVPYNNVCEFHPLEEKIEETVSRSQKSSPRASKEK